MADSALPMVLFLGFLFVSLTLILGLGLMSREEERAEEERAVSATARAAAEGNGPFRAPGVLATAQPQAAVALSPAEPNRVAPFLDDAGAGPRPAATAGTSQVDELVLQLEEYLRGESRAVAAFAAAPSVGGLLGDRLRHGSARPATSHVETPRRP